MARYWAPNQTFTDEILFLRVEQFSSFSEIGEVSCKELVGKILVKATNKYGLCLIPIHLFTHIK